MLPSGHIEQNVKCRSRCVCPWITARSSIRYCVYHNPKWVISNLSRLLDPLQSIRLGMLVRCGECLCVWLCCVPVYIKHHWCSNAIHTNNVQSHRIATYRLCGYLAFVDTSVSVLHPLDVHRPFVEFAMEFGGETLVVGKCVRAHGQYVQVPVSYPWNLPNTQYKTRN